MENQRRNKLVIWWSVAALFIFSLSLFVLPTLLSSNYGEDRGEIIGEVPAVSIISAPAYLVTHIPTPDPVKGIYMTACVAQGSTWREELKKLVESTELNAIVVDVKDYSGFISISDPALQDAKAGCKVKDLREFINELHKSNIYAIARVSVFQDPYYTALHPELAVKSKSTGGTWRDYKGLSFIDVGAKPFWDYIVKLSIASFDLGFDEVNFDYIRYPSDGNMDDTYYSWMSASSTRAETLESFFSYLQSELKGKGKISADLFGITTTATDDMGIGQILERALPYFDYISPMVYPSHYGYGHDGYGNPAEYPYEIVKKAMDTAVLRERAWQAASSIATTTVSKLRPWLQDFDYRAYYDVAEVRAQIKAVYDSGLSSWLMWDAGNKYTTGAYLPE